MRIERLTLKGFFCFPAPVTLDLRDLPPGLIAITGPNGAGKTTLLEAGPAAVLRTWLSREGALADYATGADSFLDVELAMEGRGAYRSRISVDGVKGTSGAVLEQVHATGQRTVLNDGKVSTFDAVVRDLFPSKELLLASAFAAQNKAGSFVSISKKDRKDLFATFLGLARYQTMSDTARQAASFVEQARVRQRAHADVLARDTAPEILHGLELVADTLQKTGGDAELRLTELQAQLATFDRRLAACEALATAHVTALDRARTLDADLQRRVAERAAAQQQQTMAVKEWVAERQRLTTMCAADIAVLDTKIAGNQTIRTQADAIRAAVETVGRLDAEIATLQDLIAEQECAAGEVMQRHAQTVALLAACAARADELARAKRGAELLAHVPCGGAGAFASCQFLTDATTARDRIADLEAAVAPRADLITGRDRLAAEHQAHRDAIAGDRQAVRARQGERSAAANTAAYADKLAAAEARIVELTEQRLQCERDAETRIADGHARAEARRAELTTLIDSLDALIGTLETARAAALAHAAETADGHREAQVVRDRLAEAHVERDACTRTLATVEAGRADLARRQAEVQAKRAHLVETGARLAQLDAELLDWQFLTKAFGREGLPVLEIDAAGPTISAYTNELLAVCYDTRFSVDLVTQRAKADGKGYVDDFTVQVLDNERGGEPRDLADLSGGEQVIVAEALCNAIGVYVNTRSPMPVRTCWRDETTGALDPENGVRYLQMLRKVQTLGGYHHVLFICHNPDLAATADAQIRVAHGTVTVVQPPYSEAA